MQGFVLSAFLLLEVNSVLYLTIRINNTGTKCQMYSNNVLFNLNAQHLLSLLCNSLYIPPTPNNVTFAMCFMGPRISELETSFSLAKAILCLGDFCHGHVKILVIKLTVSLIEFSVQS